MEEMLILANCASIYLDYFGGVWNFGHLVGVQVL